MGRRLIEVREDVLKEVDRPMLKYGLQALHTSKLPSKFEDRPSKAADPALAEPILDIGESFSPRTKLPIPQIP
jgi:hypothetical protein